MSAPRLVPLLLFVLAVLVVIATFVVNFPREAARMKKVGEQSPSRIYADLLIQYDAPPIYQEEWRMQDVQGVSTYSYRIRSYGGTQITISQPKGTMVDVSYFFGHLDQDGVWQIVDQPSLGNTHAAYTVEVKQYADFKQGQRTITFTDPHYLATTREYHLDLSKQSPNDLLKMKSIRSADDRYQKVVDDFLNFGPPEFRARIAAARSRLRAGK